jgi:D-serine dehydratase
MLTGKHDNISVQDFGIDNITAADGLAVGTPSSFVGRIMEPLLDGIYTIEDDILFALLTSLRDSVGFELEPSALAGFPGPVSFFKDKKAADYLKSNNLKQAMNQSPHIVWSTGGSMVPADIKQDYYERGKEVLN